MHSAISASKTGVLDITLNDFQEVKLSSHCCFLILIFDVFNLFNLITYMVKNAYRVTLAFRLKTARSYCLF
jgi:hypothetical protein